MMPCAFMAVAVRLVEIQTFSSSAIFRRVICGILVVLPGCVSACCSSSRHLAQRLRSGECISVLLNWSLDSEVCIQLLATALCL
jgi:hypothetical protein